MVIINKKNSSGKYRPEIDGLRAFAVLIVIINHFNKEILPSGYLGVDIFFVISGFVITSSLEERKSKNFWEFIFGFYERRIKRLIPALILFVLLTSLLSCLFSSPNITSHLKTGISSLFGFSNIALFLKSKNYFAASEQLNPFLHTWSLGVEEQFYLLFPFIIWFTGFGRQSNNGKKNLFLVILFLGVLSLLSFTYLYSIDQPAAYFLMPNRFWEISSGCLLFIILKSQSFIVKIIENLSPLFILILMIAILFLPITFAVPSTLLMVFLSLLLISCLREETSICKLLTNKKVVYIGLISYPLYLWHGTILSVSRLTIGIHWWSVPFQIGLIFLLAISSYKWLETPLRKKKWSPKKLFTILKGIISLTISAIILILLENPLKGKLYLGDNTIEKDYKFYNLNDDENFCPKKNKVFGENGNIKLAECFTKSRETSKTLFFLGDSHNLSFLAGAEFISNKTDSNLYYERSLYTTINKTKSDAFLDDLNMQFLYKAKAGDVVFIIIRMPTRFLDDWYEGLGSKEGFENWLYALYQFRETLSKKNIKLVLSNPIPEFPNAKYRLCKEHNKQWFNKLNRKDCYFPLKAFNGSNGKYSQIIESLKEISSKYDNLYLFDALTAMCPQEECNYSLNDKLLYRDDDHISDYAARYVVAPQMLKFLNEYEIIENESQ